MQFAIFDLHLGLVRRAESKESEKHRRSCQPSINLHGSNIFQSNLFQRKKVISFRYRYSQSTSVEENLLCSKEKVKKKYIVTASINLHETQGDIFISVPKRKPPSSHIQYMMAYMPYMENTEILLCVAHL